MPEDNGGWLKDVWHILKSKASIRPMLAVVIIGLPLVLNLSDILEKLKLTNFVTTYWPWIFLAFAFSVVMLLIHGVEALARPIIADCRIKARFHSLANDEKRIVNHFCGSGVNTAMMWSHEPGVGTLLADGLLFEAPSDLTSGMRSFGLSIGARRFVRKHKKKIPALLFIEQPQAVPQVSRDGP